MFLYTQHSRSKKRAWGILHMSSLPGVAVSDASFAAEPSVPSAGLSTITAAEKRRIANKEKQSCIQAKIQAVNGLQKRKSYACVNKSELC